jgi:hypothetical protein
LPSGPPPQKSSLSWFALRAPSSNHHLANLPSRIINEPGFKVLYVMYICYAGFVKINIFNIILVK